MVFDLHHPKTASFSTICHSMTNQLQITTNPMENLHPKEKLNCTKSGGVGWVVDTVQS